MQIPSTAVNDYELTDSLAQAEMRIDLQQSLSRGHVEPGELSTFQRILLTTDGTLTDILEAYLFESIQVVKLQEILAPATSPLPALEVVPGDEIIDRRILLRGRISRKNFIYAESILVPERLDPKFKDDLLKSKRPLGRLWLEYRVETFKEIVDSVKESAGDLATYFNISPDDYLLSRTYRVISKGIPLMTITEKFPQSYFRKDF